ncbi:hypothetical protein C7J88_08545 [Staphylococcus muscae]|uniref:DUF1129 domain-containing protein n=1 Tax=Staphylococcus muscae TaxID=1294 RepID=A0A240BUH2_9STAP|nr:hypothetical protein [Staphylococcus muscae]AVQ34207.1 hypothetical protein C7J88_08545 [Staphylococcus muscae]PNZ03325.1 hypothetical protein CD131_06465 [Staphylococcus muscae]GGA85208.1 hypothetical protein GCM10007183_06750 [Staphylococcus muscae]SNV99457.1 Uncharacterised protein [Staphylococcus muscae]
MRENDRELLKRVEAYLSDQGVSPNAISDIKESLRRDIQKSEQKNIDYTTYRQKSTAEILLTIQKNLFIMHFNPVVFFVINFIMIAYLYSKQLVPFGAVTGLFILYVFVILPISILVYYRVRNKNYLYHNQSERYLGVLLAVGAFVLMLMHTFDVTLGIHVVTHYAHMAVAIAGLIITMYGLYRQHYEHTGIGLLLLQKTIDIIVPDAQIAQYLSITLWIMLLVMIIIYTIDLSSNKERR